MGHPWNVIIDEEKTERKTPDIVLARRLLSYVFPYKARMTALAMLVIIASVLSLLPPYLSGMAVDDYIMKGDLQGLGLIGIAYVLIYLFNWVVSYAQTYMTTWVGRRVEYDLRMSVFHKLQLLSLTYYDTREAGRITSRVTNDVDNLTDLVTSGMMSMFADFLTLFAIIGIMLYMSATLALMAFTVIPVIIIFTWLFGRKSREAYRKTRRAISGVTAQVEETVSGIKEVQSYSKEQEAKKEFEKANVTNLRANVSAARIQSTFFPAVGVFGALGTCIVLWSGGTAVASGALTIGVLIAFIQYMNRFFWPIQDLSMFYIYNRLG
jgi:ABC-type multidrug transport system fused ATPase/permease subunit